MNNTTGGSNTAIGWEALTANTTGNNNTALGTQALQTGVATSNHVAVGNMAGSGITTVDNNIIIGHHSGVHSVFGQENDVCYIDNIFGATVSATTARSGVRRFRWTTGHGHGQRSALLPPNPA